jgi:transcriptional regulator with XRE-family HTH domain
MRHPYPDVVLGDMVRQMRLEAGMQVSEVAEHMNWPTSRLRALEDGTDAPSFSETAKLVRLFDLDIEEFACAYMTNSELSQVDFNALEAELARGMTDSIDADYYVHD